MKNLITQVPLSPPGGFQGKGPLGLEGGGAGSAGSLFETALSTAIGALTFIAGIYFLVNLLLGGIGYIRSGGDKTAVEGARKKMTYSLIGLVIVIAAYFGAALIGRILGFSTILNPAAILN